VGLQPPQTEFDSLLALKIIDYMKIFCIGLNKTGTTSLVDAWRELGYDKIYSGIDKATLKKVMPTGVKINGRNIVKSGINNDFDILRSVISGYDCLKDRPFNTNHLYRWLDENYKESKFILTVRGEDEWWNSVNRWLTNSTKFHDTEDKRANKIQLYKDHFNTTEFTKDSFIDYYRDYNSRVRKYFKGKSNFLELNICNGDGWKTLCSFLEKTVPNKEFPKSNINSYN
jgi:hypothetical protein